MILILSLHSPLRNFSAVGCSPPANAAVSAIIKDSLGEFPGRRGASGAVSWAIDRSTPGDSRQSDLEAIPAMTEEKEKAAGSRRDEDIALDMMKFIAGTTGYGKTGTPGAGFQGGMPSKPEDYAQHLLELYGQCLSAVKGKT
jgi:hypothetical protein